MFKGSNPLKQGFVPSKPLFLRVRILRVYECLFSGHLGFAMAEPAFSLPHPKGDGVSAEPATGWSKRAAPDSCLQVGSLLPAGGNLPSSAP